MIRVLHVIENFSGQAVESWLTRLLACKSFDQNQLHFEFFLLGSGLGKYVNVVSESGCMLHEGNPGGASLPQMALTLRRLVRIRKYEIVHIHQDVLAGIFALALAGTGVRIITHVHNCWQRLPVGGVMKERILTQIARRLALWRSDAIVGVSGQALETMRGANRRSGRLDRVIYCSAKGISQPTDASMTRSFAADSLRVAYEISPEAKILLFLGRLDDYKNPHYAVDILKSLLEGGGHNVHLIIAGIGRLAESLRQRTASEGLARRCHLIGWVDDPSTLLLGADLLLMPSSEVCGEGLGLAAVEAQACGLPVLASLSIPGDAGIVPGLLERLSLKAGPAAWTSAAGRLLAARRVNYDFCARHVAASAFTDCASYQAMRELYQHIAAV